VKLSSGPVATQGALLRQVHGELPREQAVRVLSIDGGGVRGLVTAMVLAEIEARTGRHLADLFDIVAGTSTGAVLAVGLAVPGDKPGVPRWSARDGVEIYSQRLPEVFDRSGWQALSGIGSLWHEKYDEGPLEAMLHDYFGDYMLSDALTNVVVPAYDIATNDVLLFDSAAAQADPAADMPMRMVVRGATAAPTYFEPALVGPPYAPEERLLVDGGVFANNPGVCAFMQAQRRHLGCDVIMVSLGTGAAVRPPHLGEVKSWGVAHWARPLFNLVLDSASQATDHHLRSLLGEQRYFRFQAALEGCGHRLDDASAANLSHLRQAGEAFIAAKSEDLDRACALLDR
jgi:patatin-like phospholipase/acyl hydrolase